MSHRWRLKVQGHLGIGLVAVGLTLAVTIGPASSLAQDLPTSNVGKSAATGMPAGRGHRQQGLRSDSGISLAEPIGSVSIAPRVVDGEPIFVRRTAASAGMTVVEVSTTPFMSVVAVGEAPRGVRADQPASW